MVPAAVNPARRAYAATVSPRARARRAAFTSRRRMRVGTSADGRRNSGSVQPYARPIEAASADGQ